MSFKGIRFYPTGGKGHLKNFKLESIIAKFSLLKDHLSVH